jgi:hypothetical protein
MPNCARVLAIILCNGRTEYRWSNQNFYNIYVQNYTVRLERNNRSKDLRVSTRVVSSPKLEKGTTWLLFDKIQASRRARPNPGDQARQGPTHSRPCLSG